MDFTAGQGSFLTSVLKLIKKVFGKLKNYHMY